VALIVELRSGDPTRVAAALRATRTMSPAVASQVVSLLAWDQVTGWASRALSKAAPSITGQLIDRLLDPAEDFAIRRRIPRILATCHTPRAFDGLVAALDDPRFEVRYQSGRALARIHAQIPAVPLSHAVVYAAVARETRVGKPLWQDQRLLDEPSENDANPVIDEALRLRANRSVEHVFTLLSLVLPREPLQIAFKGLLTDDSVLRGTSLEYLESVLPGAVWQGMRPLLEDRRTTTTPPRSSAEILEVLMRSSASIDLKLTPGRPPGPTRQD
ncbi:MAG TPA: HEAT repeat domain-containing protein, partial [Candidatus Krumholzibacteria bacterium]|nr:HEAT repeat domain-containing protein [Candidatus Krumholzibacteria bacterium]